MKFILVSCIFLFSLNTSAQDLTDRVLEAGKLFQSGQFAKAIPIAEKVALEVDNLMGRDNMIYQGMITIQAYSYANLYQYGKAEPLYIQLCELHKNSSSPEKEQHYATCLNNLAKLYTDMARYERAESLLIESKEITRRLFGEMDSSYSYNLNNLAALYHSMGQYQKAEPLYMQARDIRKKVYGENHTNYATSLNNLGVLYMEMGQPGKAIPFFIQSKEIFKKARGEMYNDYAMYLNNLASAYEDMDQYSQAESLYIQANLIRKELFGEIHPDYAMGLNNLASLYTNLGQYNKAEPLIIQAKDIWKTVLGTNHPNYATAVNNLGAFYRKSETRYPESEQLYKEALELRRRILGPTHPFSADSENDLALLYSNMKLYARAEPLLLSSSISALQNLLNTFTVLSEKEKSNYLDYQFVYTETNNSFLYNYPAASPDMIKSSFNLQLGFKSAALSDTRNVLEAVRNSSDQQIKKLFDQWQLNNIIIARQYTLPVEQRLPNLATIEEETESLEKELTRRSSSFRSQQTALKVSQQDVQSKLGNDEAAIEFVRFRLYTSHWTDTVIYAAYVLRKNDRNPAFIPLCQESQLDKLSIRANRTATGLARVFYSATRIPGKETPGDSLYKLIWKPLENYLEGIKKVSYSPAGKLFSIAFHALPIDTARLLIDKFQLEQYTSTRQIALRNDATKIEVPGSIVLFGDARFTMDSAQLVKKRKTIGADNSTASVNIPGNRADRGGIWNNLPGTAEEVRRIGQLFVENKISTTTYIQEESSEENLKSLDGHSPRILHVATHGFFLPEPDKKLKDKSANNYSLANDPLLRSGLVLAGGNYVWVGRSPLKGIEDGIVTAYEISRLNLSNTDLVVLSACETGLGDVKGSEGVFGLQRSFKIAGIKNLVVSLWQVPDKETVELMTAFYTYRMSGKSISEAFYLGQSDVRKKYPPFYWAAFVLVQ